MPDRDANKARYFFNPAAYSEEKLKVADFTGREKISQAYQFELTLVSEDPEIAFEEVVDEQATFTMMRRDESFPVHGIVSDFQQRGFTADLHQYRATLVPRLWRLSLTHQSRIFQDMTVEDIVRQVLQESGLTSQDMRFSLDESYREREYCAQYQETDLNFVSRLLEHEGIQFFFEQKEGQEIVVFTDHGREHTEIEGESTVRYKKPGVAPEEPETVREFVYRQQVVTGKVKVKDYDYEKPSTMEAESQINDEMPGMHYEYGPHFEEQSEGDRLARVRNEEIECQRKEVDGNSICLRFRAGQEFALDQHYRDELNQTYLLTEIRHVGSQRAGMGLPEQTEEEVDYRNEFKCAPASVQYRPPRVTPVPQVPGVMTAEVDGSGDYAYLDGQGRYRAEMHFDQRDKSPGTATHPLRMKQPYSGKGEAGFHKPSHPGTEMVWACENGDPDRPMALGTAPNPNNESPVTNANNSQHIFQTTSDNKLIVEDQKSNERISLFSPYENSLVTIGSGMAKNEGITASTKGGVGVGAGEGVSIRGHKGIMLSAWSEQLGGEATSSVLGNVKGALKALTSYASTKFSFGFSKLEGLFDFFDKTEMTFGYLKQALVEVGKGYEEYTDGETSATAAFSSLDRPGIFATCEGGVDVISKEDVTLIPGGGFAVFTPLNAELSALAGIELITGKDIGVFSKEGRIEILADDDIVKIDGKKQVAAESGEQIVLECGDSKIIMNSDGSIVIKGKEVEIEGENEVDLETSNENAEIELEGSKIGVNASEVEVEGKNSTEISGNSVKIDAMDVTSESKGYTVKGTLIDLNGDIVEVKGSLNKIG